MLLVVSLGLLAAFLFAASAALQQRAAARAEYAGQDRPAGGGGRIRSVFQPLVRLARRLVRTPLWLAGWVTNLAGFMAQAAALHFGSVAQVQPLLVTQLLFALPLASAWNRSWPSPPAWLAALSISGGLAVFLAVRGVAPGDGTPDRQRVILAGLSALILIGLLVAAAAGRRALVHATLISVAAGLCFAMSAVLMKLTAEDLAVRGIPTTAVDWPGYALAASTLLGLLLEQGAFAAGSLPAAVAAMTITNPLASYLIGVLAFHLVLPASPGALAALAAAGALLCAGAVGLAQTRIVLPDNRGQAGYYAAEQRAATTQHS